MRAGTLDGAQDAFRRAWERVVDRPGIESWTPRWTRTRGVRTNRPTSKQLEIWDRLTSPADHFYRQGPKVPVCDMKTMAPLVMAGLFKDVPRSAVEITLGAKKSYAAITDMFNPAASQNICFI